MTFVPLVSFKSVVVMKHRGVLLQVAIAGRHDNVSVYHIYVKTSVSTSLARVSSRPSQSHEGIQLLVSYK